MILEGTITRKFPMENYVSDKGEGSKIAIVISVMPDEGETQGYTSYITCQGYGSIAAYIDDNIQVNDSVRIQASMKTSNRYYDKTQRMYYGNETAIVSIIDKI